MNALPTMGRTDLSLDVVRQCLRARSLFSLGMIVGSRSVLRHALMLVYETSEQVPSGQLPFIDGGIPFVHEVISHARSRWAAIQKAEQAYESRQSKKPGKTLADVLVDQERPMGHAFVLKAMLLYGSDVTPELVLEPPMDSDPKPPEESTRSRVQQVLF